MSDLHGFDARTVEPTTDFEAIPAGKYLAIVSDSEMRPTKAGTGSFLELVFEIIEGEHKGRKLWARLNLDNPNALTVKIAQGELSALCRATGILTPHDSSELHNLPLIIGVKVKKRDDNDEPTNVVSSYAKKESAIGQPQLATSNTPPWARR